MPNELIAKGRVESVCINGEVKPHIDFWFNGVQGDKHVGFRRMLSKHDGAMKLTSELEKGAEVFNTRQWSGISTEEIGEIEAAIYAKIPPGILQENLTLSGVPNFSKLLSGTRIVCPMRDGHQAILAVWQENKPCYVVGRRLAEFHHREELEQNFIRHAQGKRGVVGFVISLGRMMIGDEVLVYPPIGE
jgi:hypothetical protein